MYRRILLASVGAIALAGSALAADLPSRAPPPVYVPPAPIFTWTGIYIGGQIGYAWGKSNTNLGDDFGDYASFSTNNSGVIGGAHVGYNLQLSQFVIGLEGDVDGSSLKKTISSSHYIDGFGLVEPTSINGSLGVQGSIRGRIGYAWDRVLFTPPAASPSAASTAAFRPRMAMTAPRPPASAGRSAAVSNTPSPTIGRSGLNIAMPSSVTQPFTPTIRSARQTNSRARSALTATARSTRTASRSASATSSTRPRPLRSSPSTETKLSSFDLQDGRQKKTRPAMAGFSAF